MRELEVLGVRMEVPSRPLLLLRDPVSNRCLPIWIGLPEATAITTAIGDVVAPRPLTHDLLAEVLDEFAPGEISGRITDMTDGVFLGELVIDDHTISARPSDLVALAVRMGFTLTCPAELIDRVGVELEPASDDEVERFREFLEQVTAEDFEADS